MKEIIVTTCDVKQDYQIICPVCVQISNNGALGKTFNKLSKEYLSPKNQIETPTFDENTMVLLNNKNIDHSKFEQVFFIGVEELKKRAKSIGADAVIGLRQDFDLGENDFDYFYLQLYGTAIKFKQ